MARRGANPPPAGAARQVEDDPAAKKRRYMMLGLAVGLHAFAALILLALVMGWLSCKSNKETDLPPVVPKQQKTKTH